ncbi:uncharacterized protein LOC120259516 [Dioscorea cayenensis subsp. rotundata]|uniref:Uncharacterized protein LOC120259516 n=1 Tax=Dioscorea cayennensis subsp. rotundata TaxID=55577 RepID=A0AB40B8R0_DIOCR|nr:uncharacterized protein LOC120259516 [Dioscorea cayenensis subsp. rotundata]
MRAQCSPISSSSSSILHSISRRPRFLFSLPTIAPSYRPLTSLKPISINGFNSSRHSAEALPQCSKIEDEEVENGSVHCEMETVSWRERRIKACILVDADVESVWNVLTDYERLADFVPNLVYSGRIPCPHRGRIWLEQRGLQRALYWHIEARVVLDLQELPDLDDGCELLFAMVDGDFKKFEGKWSVKAGPRASTAVLSYEVNVIPTFNFPAIFIERIIRCDLPVNLRAIACRAERNSEENQMSSDPKATSGVISDTDLLSPNQLNEKHASFGNVSPAPSIEHNSKWGVFGKVCRLDRPCMVDEVHLRRFDGLLENGGTHRCVAASITVKAPISEVWNVLTAYEALPEFVPNLAISKILSREKNKVRILQEGCKGLLYMVLHARVVLELHEIFEREISFEQVEGDFDLLKGKWHLEQLGNQHTLMKYTVESKMHKDTFLSEAIVEEVVYEDLPSNLCAIRDFVENRLLIIDPLKPIDAKVVRVENSFCVSESKPAKQNSSFDASSNSSRQRSKVPGLQSDIEVLKAELLKFISEHGQEGYMPMRKQLRSHGRVDIEKAISRYGGFRKTAILLNLSLAYKHRKPKGYWDNLENLQEEISRFQRKWGMDPAYMPSRKSFERAGRYDIARALEKWGGLQEVSRLLSLELRHTRRRSNLEKSSKLTDTATSDDSNAQGKMSSKPLVSQDAQKWLMKLKDLDINWVE